MAPRGTSTAIAAELRQLIGDGSLQPGDVLPSEARLAEYHLASRGTVRSALALLRQQGVIETVAGRGWRVAGGPAGDLSGTEWGRVVTSLSARIRAGEFGTATPLPSEAELVKEFGVSRNTVRRAYRYLVESGAVVVRHGVGAFAAPR